MKVEIRDDVLVVEAESESETLLLKKWRENWHKIPKAEKWFEVHYISSVEA